MRTRLDLFVILALAVYRLWRLIARDDITARWREQLYNRWPPSATRAAGVMEWNPRIRQVVYRVRGREQVSAGSARRLPAIDPPKVSWLAAAVDCPWCFGAWLAAVATVLADASFGLVWPVAWFLALSTAVGLLGRADAK